MKSEVPVFLIFFALLAFLDSCKQPHNNLTGGGKGGNGTISVSPEHGGIFIDSCTVYIKYATLNAPPTDSMYDDSVSAPLHYVNDTVPVAVFHNLKAGIYYIYATGIHVGYSPPYVKGGVPFTLVKQDSENVVVPVYPYNK